MKPNVIVALLVGAVLGFVVGKVVSGTSPSTDAPAAVVAGKPTPVRPGGPGNDAAPVKVPLDGKNPVKGSPSALVTIVEFSDYQCPFCARAEGTMKQIASTYGDKVRFVMKQNPLGFHDRAKPAALAALAAGEQGKYWEMHDKLFTSTQALDDASLEGYAKAIGLNVERWKAAMSDSKLGDIIQRDQALAAQLGATGTPAFFINGRKISGAQPFENFKRVIDEELPKAEALVKAGTRAEEVYGKLMEQAAAAAPAAPAPSAPAQAEIAKVSIPAEAPIKGPKFAKVTVVVFSDFQCPFCSRVVPTLKQIEEKYGKDVRVVFRHQPLSFHDKAQLAAEASMAAQEQGKFWQMHDTMFANQSALDRASLERYAQNIGLNVAKFKAALDSGKYRAYVQADSAAGNAVGANGTPTFFINGRKLVGAQPFESFKSVIDDELQKANKALASGTKLEQLYEKLQEGVAAAPVAPAAQEQAKVDIAVGNAPVKGPKNAPVTIVAYSDFECPFCSRVVPTLKQLEEQYKGKIKVAFKHQPLPFHQNARLAAAASMAAHEQGKFWEMHDKLFENQRALDRASLDSYAKQIGLDVKKFGQALDSKKFEALITADSTEGSKVGANGTPTFFINGRQLVGAQPINAFQAIIDDELKKAGK